MSGICERLGVKFPGPTRQPVCRDQVPNRLRRLWSKAMVVSTEGKGLARTRSGNRQEEDRKGTTMEVSKVKRRCQNRGEFATAGPSSDETCLRAERHPA